MDYSSVGGIILTVFWIVIAFSVLVCCYTGLRGFMSWNKKTGGIHFPTIVCHISRQPCRRRTSTSNCQSSIQAQVNPVQRAPTTYVVRSSAVQQSSETVPHGLAATNTRMISSGNVVSNSQARPITRVVYMTPNSNNELPPVSQPGTIRSSTVSRTLYEEPPPSYEEVIATLNPRQVEATFYKNIP